MLIESLRDYQIKAIEELRDGVREGHRCQILVAPTGAGKTVSASYLLNEAREKKSVAWFICDRCPWRTPSRSSSSALIW